MSENTIKTGVEKEIESVVQSVNEWDDRTSPDDYPDHLLITSQELADILRDFAVTTLQTLQLEVDSMRTKAISNAQERNAAEAREKLLREALEPFGHIGDEGRGSALPDDAPLAVVNANMPDLPKWLAKVRGVITQGDVRRARQALANAGGSHAE